MSEEFYCKGKSLADYLIANGSNLIRVDKENGIVVFVFKKDQTIEQNIAKYEETLNKCMF